MNQKSSRNRLQKLFKTQAPSHYQDVSFRQHHQQNSQSLYNLKDFLPQASTSNLSFQMRQVRQKTKSTIVPPSSSGNNFPQSSLPSNVDQRLMEQKMNKLKQENLELKQKVDEQSFMIKGQQNQIQDFKSQIERILLEQQKKLNQLAMWSYKYHVQYTPKEKHKYSIAIQTQDSQTSKTQSSTSLNLRAKDFQDIYRRLNSNPSTISIGTKKTNTQFKSNIKFASNITLHNPSVISANSEMTKKNKSIFPFNRKQEVQNKENQMGWSNVNFSKNPMEINISRIQSEEKPIKQQCIEIYPVDQQYVDSIVGQLLCSDQM